MQVGTRQRYRDACREMLDRFEKIAEENPEIAERTAKTCALAPDAVPDFSHVERMADRCITGTEGHAARGFFMIAKGLTDCRVGRYADAIRWLEPTVGGQWDVIPLSGLAMAHHRLGHADDARAALASARVLLEKQPPAARRLSKEWTQSEILFREAETLLGVNHSQAASSLPSVPLTTLPATAPVSPPARASPP